MSNKLVSVLINCFNGAYFINFAIDSVINQTYKKWEIIIWDNLSTDQSEEIVKNYNDSRIKYYKASTHTTQYEARKQAMYNCKGDYIAFLDVDDWWDSTKLEKQIPLFDNSNVGFVCSNAWIVNERKHSKKIAFKKIPKGHVLDDLLIQDFITMSSLIVKKEIYFKLDYGFDPSYEIIGDFDLVVRLSMVTDLGSTDEPLTYYRLHYSNLTYLKMSLDVKELIKLKNKLQKNTRALKSKNFYIFENNILFNTGLMHILENNRLGAMSILTKMTSYKHIIKLIIVLCVPKIFLIKLRAQ